MDERPHVGSSRWAGNLSRRVFLGRSGMGLLATMASGLSLVPERQSQARPLATFRQARYIMGTIVEIAVAAPDQHTAYQAMAHGFQALKQVDQRMSIYQAGSELCRVNRLAAGRWVHTDTDILTVMTEALSLSHLSHGGLDVTVLPLMQLWGFVQRAGPFSKALSVVGGAVLVVLGALMLTGNMGLLVSWGFSFFNAFGYERLQDYL